MTNDKIKTTVVRPQESHEVDYRIYGADMQCIEIYLDHGETAIAENGSLMYMDQGVQMDTKISDGSKKNSGLFGSMMGAAKRHMTGENMFMAFFTNNSRGKLRVAFAAPYPGSVIPLDLRQLGGSVHCQKGAFLCCAKGVSINIGFTKKIAAGMFGGEGYVLQKLIGDGLAFIHAGGSIIERELKPGQILYVDTGSVVGFQSTITFDIKMVSGFKNIMFGGEELFLSTLRGPGKVWIQSMPYHRLVGTIRHTMMEQVESNKK